MTSHDPDTLRRILLLLKGKKKAGHALSKKVAQGHGKVLPQGRMEYDPKSKEASALPAEIATREGQPLSDVPHHPDLGVREQFSDEIAKMMQLLDSAQEAKKKLKARGVGR